MTFTAAADEARRRLAETIAWCTEVADPAHALRSPALQPDGYPTTDSIHCEPSNARAVVDALAVQRRTLLRSAGIDDPPLPDDLGGGRLLLTSGLTESITSGESEAASNGFFDIYDMPPWDTWVACLQDSSVLCWVPPAHVTGQTDRAIDVNPYEELRWAAAGEVATLLPVRRKPLPRWLRALDRPLRLPER